MQHAIYHTNGVIHYSTTDAVFRTLDGKPIIMEFHRYCGPSFSLDGDDWNFMPDEDSKEWVSMWKQFDGWMNAKGKEIYK